MTAPAARGSLEEAIEAAVQRALAPTLARIEAALRDLHPATADDLLTVEEAAQLIGYKVRTLRAKAKLGEVPAFRPPGSRTWRFRRATLLDWMQQRVTPALDLETQSRKIAAQLKRGG